MDWYPKSIYYKFIYKEEKDAERIQVTGKRVCIIKLIYLKYF